MEYVFCQNGIRKGKGLGLGLEPLHIKLCRVPPPPGGGEKNTIAKRPHQLDKLTIKIVAHVYFTG